MVKRRKTKVAPPAGCPLRSCMDLIAGAWTADVLWYLRGGERCFSELQQDLQGVSAKMLTARLKRLERDGLLERHERATSPPTVWYQLTPVGAEFALALHELVLIGQKLKRNFSQPSA
ncbi:MAG: helix-turn-helix domain-containing protein [Bryobacter sp.]